MFRKSKQDATHLNESTTRGFLLTITLMCMAGLIGSDIYLPTLPSIADSLHKSDQSIQLTLGIYLLGLALGQIFFGPVSEYYGRKRSVMIGMLIYIISSLMCAFSVEYYQLLISRVLQALGASSGLVIGRAIVVDRYDAKEAGKIFATVLPFVGMSPAISPIIGGMISLYFGWRSTFIFVSLYACFTLWCVYQYIVETKISNINFKINVQEVFNTYWQTLTNKKFISYACAPCAAYLAFFAYIAQSPFIFHQYGFTEREIGFFYFTLSLTYLYGSFMSKKHLEKSTLSTLIDKGFVLFNLGAILLTIGALVYPSLLIMVISFSILTFGNGYLIPLGTAGAVKSVKLVGYASGLLGFLQLGSAAMSASLIGNMTNGTMPQMALFITTITILSYLFFKRVSRSTCLPLIPVG